MLGLCVVDYQADFINANGALSVPGAEEYYKNNIMERVLDFAELCGAKVFFTADIHDGDEPEMVKNGGPFPLHCMRGSEGAKILTDTSILDVFGKQCYNVFDKEFGNPNIASWLKVNNITQVLLCGIVGNICVEAAANGFRKLGIDVTLIENATVWMNMEQGIFSNGEPDNMQKSIARMKANSVRFVNY